MKDPEKFTSLTQTTLQKCRIGFWSITEKGESFFDPYIQNIFDSNITSFEDVSACIMKDDLEDFLSSDFMTLIKTWQKPLQSILPFELRISLKGEMRFIKVKTFFQYEENRITEIYGFFEDVTAEKKKEQETLRQLSRLALLGEISTTICHEINTPLSVLTLYSGHIQKELNKTNQDKTKLLSSLQKIDNIAVQIAKIVKGIKYYMSPPSNEEFESVLLVEIINNSIEICSERLKSHDIQMEVSIAPDLEIECRSFQISQIITNLILNSIQAIEALDERWIKLSAEVLNDLCLIRVMDSGKGIEAGIARHIMKPFFTTRHAEGTGVGLSVSKDLTDQHGGNLRYDAGSEHTLFILEIPLKRNF